MKKLTLVAGAVLGLISSAAMAQTSTVTVYGILDAGISSVSNLKNGNSMAVVSGIMDGSRFGLRGNEDLGGGYSAMFTLENRFELDSGAMSNRPASGAQLFDRVSSAAALGLTGAAAAAGAIIPTINSTIASQAVGVNIANNLFDRQAFVGLVTPVGAVTVGRQYTPAYLVGATFDAAGTQSSLAAGQVASLPGGFDIRLSNSIQYGIRKGAVSATFMYAPGEIAGNDDASRFYGAMAMYTTKDFAVGFGYNTKNNEQGKTSLTNNVIGARVNVGPGALFGQFATIVDENPSGIPSIVNAVLAGAPAALAPLAPAVRSAYQEAFRQDANLFHVGYKLTTGASTWVVAYSRYDDNKAANSDVTSYGFTHTYALSKRTSLNTVVTQFTNDGLAQAAPGAAGYLGGVTAKAGEGSTNIAFGVNHKF